MNQGTIDSFTEYLGPWLRLRYERLDLPGFTVAVAYKGKVVFNQAYGYSNLETNTKLKIDDIFQIASQSKAFTATAIMQLQEAGKLSIDDPVINYVSWLQDHSDTRFRSITIRQLLSHSAGITRDGKDADYWDLRREFPTPDQFKEYMLDTKLVINSDVQLKYSNFGFALLGLVIEHVSGMSYNEYVTKNIIDKLGLSSTAPEYNQAIASRVATGYSRPEIAHKRLPIDNVLTNALSPATGLYSNAADLCTYFSALCTGTNQLLNDESKKEMQRTHRRVTNTKENEEYGFGIEINYVGDKRYLNSNGGFPGYVTTSSCDLENQLVVVALANSVDGPTISITSGVMSVIDFFANIPATEPKYDISRLQGRFISILGIADIVVTGDTAVSIYPNTWLPFSDPEELEYVGNNTFKIIKTNGYNSEGEELIFNLADDGTVKSIMYAGATMLPESEWNKLVQSKDHFGLPFSS